MKARLSLRSVGKDHEQWAVWQCDDVIMMIPTAAQAKPWLSVPRLWSKKKKKIRLLEFHPNLFAVLPAHPDACYPRHSMNARNKPYLCKWT